MKKHGYRRPIGASLVLLLLIALFPPTSSGQALPRRQRAESRRGEQPPPEPRRAPRPPLSSLQGEAQLLRSEDAGPALGDDGLETPIDPDDYRLGPGDQLAVAITARTPTTFTAAVSPDGFLFIPAAGDLHVGGRTLNEARAAIQKRLERIRKAGTFTASIRLVRLRRIKIQVLGEVGQPGTYLVSPLTRVLEAIARAGGLTPIASRRHVRVTRSSGFSPRRHGGGGRRVLTPEASAPGAAPRGERFTETDSGSLSPCTLCLRGSSPPIHQSNVLEVNLEEILLRGDPAPNLRLETGDLIFVPRARQVVSVAGEVHRPGDYECDPGDTVAVLLERAGGVRASGTLSAVQVERPDQGDQRRLLTADLTTGGGTLPLQDRDRVVVPRLEAVQGRLRVVGAVKGAGENWLPDTDPALPRTSEVASGIYLLRSGERVRDVLESLGGVTAKADVTKAAIERPDGNGGKRIIPVNLYRAMVMQDPEQNLPLQDGDTLLIPKLQDKIYVIGEVRHQGEQEYIEGKTVVDYIGMAGGPGPRAKRKETVIMRSSGQEPQLIRVALDKLLAGKKPPNSVAVQPGDVILVPQASIRGWQEAAQLIFTLRSLATGLFLFR